MQHEIKPGLNNPRRIDLKPKCKDPLDAIHDRLQDDRRRLHVELSKFAPARYDRAEARRHWEVPEDHRLIVCLARLHPMKGQDNLLLAAREVLKGYPQARFVLSGEGEDRARLEQFSE